MQLLVSVATAEEAQSALEGGADIIDAKDPAAGPLGAVSLEQLQAIAGSVAGRRLVTAALGDAADAAAVEHAARTYVAAGAGLVKVGFAGIASAEHAAALIAAAVGGARTAGGGVVAVAYADADRAASLPPAALIAAAARAGATGLLIDTADKHGPGLPALVPSVALARMVASAHDTGLLVALAGRLTAADLSLVQEAGADIAGVRGAACDAGRHGRVVADKVRHLRALCAAGPVVA